MTRKQVLDHGYLELVESWGSDQAVIEAARMSTDKGFLGWEPGDCPFCEGRGTVLGAMPDRENPKCSNCKGSGKHPGDNRLLKYLWENEHSTPFEFGGLTIEVQAPIAVFREWHRHRVPFGYSELSARYTPMPDLNYVPTIERIVEGSKQTKNRQASSVAGECSEVAAKDWLEELEKFYSLAQEQYQYGLNLGIPKELARLCIPVGRYSRMRATGNLRGWLAFCRLRCAPQAQWEIRMYANEVGQLLMEKFPRTWELYQEGVVKRSEEKRALKKLEAVEKLVELWAGRLDAPQMIAELRELVRT